jgi:copper transport protein
MTNRTSGLVPARRGAFALAVLVAALALVPTAAGHTMLLETQPANNSVLSRAPGSVTLRFNEPVESAFGSLRAYDPQARRVDHGDVVRPNERTVEVATKRRLPRGTYTVAWRVISADGHPISGAFVFHMQAPGANPAGIAAEVLDGGTPRSVSVLFTLVRFLDFALLLLAIGGAVALAYPIAAAAPRLRRLLLTALAAAATLLAVSALAGIVLQGAAAGGFGLGEAARWESVAAVLETRFGEVWLVQAGIALLLSLLALAARRLPRGASLALLLPAAALVPTPSLSGHASVSGDLSLVADVVHIGAAAVWTGGLAFVVAALLAAGGDRWPLAARAVPRLSMLAVGSVAVLLVAGGVNGYEQVGAWRGLWETTYGRLLLAKVALVVPLLALGAYNNRYAVPRLRREIASRREQLRFLRMAGAELAIVVVIVGVTAVLVAEPPARASVAPRGPYATTVALGELNVNVVADPARAGANTIDLYLMNRTGRPARVAELRLSASLPSKRIGPLRFDAHPLAPGHYAVHGAHFALAGEWRLRIDARRGQFDSFTATASIPIGKDS